MKYTIVIAVFVLAADLVQANTLPDLHGKHYDDFEVQGFGQLPRFWGQEAVFTPEARRWLARLEAEGYAFYLPVVGVWDVFHDEGGAISYEALQDASVMRVGQELGEELAASTATTRLDQHGFYVTSLAVGTPPFGVSVFGKLNFLINHEDFFATNNTGGIAQRGIHGSRPDVLNVSLDVATAPGLRYALPGYTTIVASAGNNPLERRGESIIAGRTPISAGASDPRGRIGHYSSDAHIYAPGEHLFLDGSRRHGTSYSAPLVTAALADMFAILPPTAITSLTIEPIVASDVRAIIALSEFRTLIVHLLQATSTPTTISGNTSSGILNHYKLLRVAHRIAQQAGSSKQRVAQLIREPRTYDFTTEAQQLYEEAVRLRNSAEVAPQEALFKLREAVALDAHNQAARQELAAIYAQAGYPSLSEFYTLLASRHQLRIHRTMDLEGEGLLNFKASLLDVYAEKINTPQLVRRYLDKDILLAMMWAGHRTSIVALMHSTLPASERGEKQGKRALPADSPWASFDAENPLPFIINYSRSVRQAKRLVDAVLGQFDIHAEKVTLTLPSIWGEEGMHAEEKIIDRRMVEIDTGFLLGHDAHPLYISDAARVARQLPVFAGQSLNLVEWSILHDSRKLFAEHHETLQALIEDDVLGYSTMDEIFAADDLDRLESANKLAAELEGHINFTVQYSDNSAALGKLLDLHQQVSLTSEHLALLRSINEGVRPQLLQTLKHRLKRLPVR